MKNTFLSLLRHFLSIAGGAVIANNPDLSTDNVQGAVGAVVALTGAAWGMYDEHKAEKKSKPTD